MLGLVRRCRVALREATGALEEMAEILAGLVAGSGDPEAARLPAATGQAAEELTRLTTLLEPVGRDLRAYLDSLGAIRPAPTAPPAPPAPDTGSVPTAAAELPSELVPPGARLRVVQGDGTIRVYEGGGSPG
ncbi:hypothetical protein SAMN05421810_10634 [Amycolatopsis arida]|uniref:Uncharacterized protein n=1 Tax=Amycolatopsis arida TaxID=587909 RepID=A0A1I5XFP6_9PSEU|nr:hypothetical protein [Amycolatopsis arida]TDX97483.1 hypothetical protein CLV69_102587 [Amycolatopsis arida]SFQ30788.1 hypothetical protein SAMN05421810_10634 [Amycolatopsis arida]